jgi:hypothetical protein
MGLFESDKMKHGNLHELKSNGTVTISEVTYDAKEDAENNIFFNDQEPIEKKVISSGNPLT